MRPGRLAGLAAIAVFVLWAPLQAAPQDALQARRLMETGLDHERTGRHPEAAAAFTQALAGKALSTPDRVRALFDRGVAFDAMGKTGQALADYAAALRLDHGFAPALNNRANALRRLGRLSEAKRDYLAALDCPGALREYPYFGLGQIAESQGDSGSARDYYLKAVAVNPSFALAVTHLAALRPEPPKPAVAAAAAPVLKPPAPKPQAVVLKPPAPKLVAPKPASSQPVSLTPAALQPPPPAPPQTAPHAPAIAQSAPDPLLRKAILEGRTGKPVQIQLGAFASQETALSAWNKIAAASGGLLAGLSPLTAEVDLPKKGHFWRLRTAVADKAAAQALCAKLSARGQACLLARD